MTRVPFFQVLHRDGWQGGGHRQARPSRQTAAGAFQNVFGFLNFESLGTILNHLDVILNHLIKLDIILDVMVFQVVSAVVEEVLQPKQNGLKAKTN